MDTTTIAAASGSLFSIDDLLERMVARGASDLHVTSGSEPAVRVDGRLERLEDFGRLTPEDNQRLLYRILSTEQQKHLETKRQLDLSYSLPGLARFRVNVVLPAREPGRRLPHHPDRAQDARGARHAAVAHRARREAPRPRPRDRPDRLR